ncbi:hypothetical protein ACFO0M_27265 [Micromonospora mangrovi]|uniref:VCBS repeat-containing protein n=2 Tax=Micromonospora TaxID=1873 RepID=A0AAU7MDS8_9ACTN
MAAVVMSQTFTANAAAASGRPAPGGAGAVSTTPVDKDFTADGIPDLLTVGGTTGLASGVWLAAGLPAKKPSTGSGQVGLPPVNIGARGNVVSGDTSPSDFDGAQVIAGPFAGPTDKDVLVYYPTGFSAGMGLILTVGSDGILGNPEWTMPAGTFTDINGDNPLQLAAAQGTARYGYGLPDLIGTAGNPSTGYHLSFYQNVGGTGGYPMSDILSNATPTGDMNWAQWTIATTELASGTAMFLWNSSTGALYLWEGLTFTDNGDMTGSVGYTQYLISRSWNAGVALSTLEAADINGDGVPDIWAVTPSGTVTAYLIARLSSTGSAQIRAGSPQTL